MKTTFQFGFDLGVFILWIAVSPKRFGEKVRPLLISSGQLATISAAELLPFFDGDLIIKDGWRLYRTSPRKEKS